MSIEYNFLGKKIKLFKNIIIDDYFGSFYIRNNKIFLWEENVIKNITLKILQKLDFKNCIYLDIGANMGSYSLLVLFLNNLSCYSYEPCKSNFEKLNEIICLNNLNSKIYINNLGLSNCKTSLNLKIANYNGKSESSFGSNQKYLRESIKNGTTEICKVDTIDNQIIKLSKKVCFIKIDTEGFEYNILKGGINTILKYRPIIQLEWNKNNMNQCDVDYKNIIKFIIIGIKYIPLLIHGEELFIIPIEEKENYNRFRQKVNENRSLFFKWINIFI